MQFFSAVVLALSFVLPGLAAPVPLIDVLKYQGQTNGKYIVKFKSHIERNDWVDKLSLDPDTVVDMDLLNGFASEVQSSREDAN